MNPDKLGRHIVINGPCSVGKTSTARKLQNKLASSRPSVLLGIDAFHLSIPPCKLDLDHPDPMYLTPEVSGSGAHQRTTIVHGPEIHKINRARFLAVTHFLDQGIDVIADELFWQPHDLIPFLQALAGYPVFIIGMTAATEIGVQREAKRSTNVKNANAQENFRPTGMHLASRCTHEFMNYDILIDSTSITTDQCAQACWQYLEETDPQPTAFNQLHEVYIKTDL